MKHRKALVIKFLWIVSILFLMLFIFENTTLLDILLISVLITGVSYLIGDLFILPRTNVFIAALADFGLNFAAIWLLSYVLIEQAYPIGIVSGFAAFFIACGEGFFHRYMIDHVLSTPREASAPFFTTQRYQTEFAKEKTHKEE